MAPSGKTNDTGGQVVLAMGLSTNFAAGTAIPSALSTVRPRTRRRPCPGDGLGSALERPADLAGQDEDPGRVQLEDPLEAILRIDEPPGIRSRPGDDDVAG